VTTKAQRESAKSVVREEAEEVLIPTPGRMSFAVDEKQGRWMALAALASVNDLKPQRRLSFQIW
jgi:hypothetical protein